MKSCLGNKIKSCSQYTNSLETHNDNQQMCLPATLKLRDEHLTSGLFKPNKKKTLFWVMFCQKSYG